MKILLVFETYSGGTLAASEYISKLLTNQGHDVTTKKASQTKLSEFNHYDFIMLGTPSWLERNEEGQPHENFIKFIEASKNEVIEPKQCAVFGLGDETYAHFGGGADMLSKFLQEKGCNMSAKPLKIDSFYVDQEKNEKQIAEWIKTLPLQNS